MKLIGNSASRIQKASILLSLVILALLAQACTSAPASESDKLRMQKIEQVIDRLGH